MMKCQHCEKAATFHITELTDAGVCEHHLCQEHAAFHLMQANSDEASATPGASIAGAIAQHFQVGQASAAMAAIDETTCPICQLTFYQFRQAGRLGCPHDYHAFMAELEPLLISIHGETRHAGKRPRRHPYPTDGLSEVIQLRRELDEAVAREDYEQASELRDRILELSKSFERREDPS